MDHHGNPFLSYGSMVIEGEGRMLAIRVCHRQQNSYADILGLTVSILIAIVVLIGLLCKTKRENHDILPELKGDTKMNELMKIIESMFWRPRGRIPIRTGVLTAILIGMQHEMSFVITVSLSYWNDKVELFGAKPRNLSACGTMGLVTAICLNATGGLICRNMDAYYEFHVGGEYVDDNVVCAVNPIVLEALHENVEIPEMYLSRADVSLAGSVKSRWAGHIEFSDQRFPIVDHGSVSSDKNYSWVVIKKSRDDGETLHLHLKGDALATLNLCSHYFNTLGEIHPIQDQRREFEQVIGNMHRRGLVAIACACKQIQSPDCSQEDSNLLALVGLKICSCHGTIETLTKAGLNVKLVSENEVSAVKDIAFRVGLLPPGSSHDVELQGIAIQDLTESARIKKLDEATVIGSCSSEDMVLIVKSLQQKGHVTAFYGGLTTTDYPALNEADLGITKRNQSTEMASKISDIVVSDECALQSLPLVLQYGRTAYRNIQ